mmetsp:Transcript_160/g.660  ORF Transcript_160/g.660 Transcript_160/m.660 type:complete len:287 (+) Transcript_160:509-1369(+)
MRSRSWSTSARVPYHRSRPLTRHSPTPGLRRSSGSSADTSSSLSAPLEERSSSATTASFSMGFSEHVEYTRRPPTRRRRAPRCAMRVCRRWRPLALATFHLRQMSGALRMVPSPEHGTSHSTRSKRTASESSGRPSTQRRPTMGKDCASCCVTSRLALFTRFVWWMSRWQRCTLTSLATTMPVGSPSPAWSFSRSWKVLEPGAAHMSSTLWCGWTSSSRGGIMDTASCRVMVPTSFSRLMYSCSSANCGRRRSWWRLRLTCHARPPGYQGSARGGGTTTRSPASSV